MSEIKELLVKHGPIKFGPCPRIGLLLVELNAKNEQLADESMTLGQAVMGLIQDEWGERWT